jgi:uncharacterized protein
MENGLKFGLLGAAAVLSLGAAGGLIGSTALASRAYQARGTQAQRQEQTLNVTGSARRRITSDLAVWEIDISGEDKELTGAYKIVKNGFDRVAAFLKNQKFSPAEISVGAIDTTEQHTTVKDKNGNETQEFKGYALRRTIVVSSRNIAAVAAAAGEVTELIQDGILVVSRAPRYHYTKLSDLKIAMIGEAAKDARNRADQIASNSGCRVSEVRNARMGVLQITQPESTDVSSEGINDTSTIEKDVTSVVALTLGLEMQ